MNAVTGGTVLPVDRIPAPTLRELVIDAPAPIAQNAVLRYTARMKVIDTFKDRQKTAADAKARLVAKLATRPAADDPAVIARAAERKAVEEARIARQAERREAEAAEEIARAAEAAAREEEAARQLAADQEAAKAKRDARYAARKQRAGQ